jgi:hypothetical protein
MNPHPLATFLSYSHANQRLRTKLRKHFVQLERDGLIRLWDDRELEVGQEFNAAIGEELERTEVFLLLVSSDFIASAYCSGIEMKRALECRHLSIDSHEFAANKPGWPWAQPVWFAAGAGTTMTRRMSAEVAPVARGPRLQSPCLAYPHPGVTRAGARPGSALAGAERGAVSRIQGRDWIRSEIPCRDR